jgi:DNA-binding GntR family transcriptional regulator
MATRSLTTLPERIADAVSARIVSGEYAPGVRLVEAVLSREFGVSHGPVRDALRLLQNLGLVTIHAYRGAEVTALSVQEVRDLYQVRAALVSLRAKWIAEDPRRMAIITIVDPAVARLARLAERERDLEAFVATSLEVNRALTDSLQNRWLRATLSAITLQTSRYTRLSLADRRRRLESARLWRTLVDTMAAGDGDLAQSVAATISLTARDAAIRALERLHAPTSPPPERRKGRARAPA